MTAHIAAYSANTWAYCVLPCARLLHSKLMRYLEVDNDKAREVIFHFQRHSLHDYGGTWLPACSRAASRDIRSISARLGVGSTSRLRANRGSA